MAAERRRGFMLIEIVVAVAVIATISLALFSVLRTVSDKERFDLAHSTLVEIDTAISRFRAKVGSNPGRISHLASPITLADSSPCGTYSNQNVTAWPGTPPDGGPFINKVFPKDSFALQGVATIQNKVTRDPAATGGTQRFHWLRFGVTGMQLADAIDLNERIDGSADFNPASSNNLTGLLQWGAPDSLGFVAIDYRVIIPKNIC